MIPVELGLKSGFVSFVNEELHPRLDCELFIYNKVTKENYVWELTFISLSNLTQIAKNRETVLQWTNATVIKNSNLTQVPTSLNNRGSSRLFKHTNF